MSKINKKNNVARFFKIAFYRNKHLATLALFVMIIIAILNLIIPQITKRILDDAIKGGKFDLLLKLIIVYGLITVLTSILSIGLEYIYSKMKNKVSIYLKVKLITHLSKLSGNYYTNMKTGNILNVMDNDVHIVENMGANLL